MKSAFVFLAILLGIVLADIYVSDSTGTDSLSCGTTTSKCKSLQYAINLINVNATDYTNIILSPGTYFANNITFSGRLASIRTTGGPNVTVLDCQRLGRGFVIINDDVQISGLTVQNCLTNSTYPGKPGAAFYVENSNLTVDNCIVQFNDAPSDPSAYGAGMSIKSSDPVITNTVFSGNKAGVAGAVYMATTSAPVFENCYFYNNTVYTGGWGGALVPEENSAGKFINCTFELNSSTYGGAVDDGGTSASEFHSCRFFNNSADYAGGYYGYGATSAKFYYCYFGYNTAINTGGAVRTTSQVTPVFEDCYFEHNFAKSAPGMAFYGESYATILRSTFANHQGLGGNGGAAAAVAASAYFQDCYFVNITGEESGGVLHGLGSPVTVVNCTFENSSSTTGGAVEFIGVTGSLTDCTFINNKATSQGGTISVIGDSVLTLSNIKIYGSECPQGGAIYVGDTAVVTLANSYIQGGAGDEGAGMYVASKAFVNVTNTVFAENIAITSGGGVFVEPTPTIVLSQNGFYSNQAKYGSGLFLETRSNCSGYSLRNLNFTSNIASNAGTVSFDSIDNACAYTACANCTFNGNQAQYGVTYSSGFHHFDLTSPAPSQLFAGELFTVSFSMKDFFNNTMAGNLAIQVFVNSTLNLKGVNTQAVATDGSATFRSLAFTGLPGNYTSIWYTIPQSPQVIIPIQIVPCQIGYEGYESDNDYICLKVDVLSKVAIGVISALVAILILVTLGVMILFYLKRLSPVIKRSQFAFCELVAFGALLNYISIFMWVDSNSSMCILRMYFLATGITIMLASLILKEYKIYAMFAAAEKMYTKTISNKQLFLGTGSAVAIEIILLIIWSGVSPPLESRSIDLTTGTMAYVCSSQNSEIFLWIVLGYEILLMAVGAVLAYLSRNIPESFNESKYIAFSVYNFIIAIVVIMPLLYVLQDLTISYLIVAIGTMFYTTVPLLMLFIPKLYYSLNKKAVVKKIDKAIAAKQNEISLLKRQRRLEIETLELHGEFTSDSGNTQNTANSIELTNTAN